MAAYLCLSTCAGAGLLLASVAALALEPALDVVRLHVGAERVRDGAAAPLLQADAVSPGERVRTLDGRLALQMNSVGLLTLGADTEIYVHSIELPDLPARMGLARIAVEQGRLRADMRARQQLPPADLRLNLGTLRARVFGAEIWAQRSMDADEICLLSGAVEVQTAEGGMRLDEAGTCLRASAAGVQLLGADAAGSLAPRLLRTAFPGDYVAEYAAQRAAAEAPGAFIESSPAPASMAPAADARGTQSWTIVLASLPDSAAAHREAGRMSDAGLDARVVEARRADGDVTHRVVSGSFASKAEAQRAVREVRKRRGLGGAWVAAEP